jgi:hypothetical protein
MLDWQMLVNLCAVAAVSFYIRYMLHDLKEVEAVADELTNTPADYAIQLKGLPKENHELATDEGIKNWLEGQSTPENPVIVKKVIRARNILTYTHKKKELMALSKKIHDAKEPSQKDLNKQEELR